MIRFARVVAGAVVVAGASAAKVGNGYFTTRDLTSAGAPVSWGATVGWVTPGTTAATWPIGTTPPT